MKKTYKMKNLGCANCAAKMERAIGKLDGVESVSVNFMFQKLTIDADENKLDEIMEKANKICKKYESDCSILL